MFSSLIGGDEDNTCIISVMDSKICACYISDSEVVWVNPIDIGKNKFDEESSIITTRKKEKFNLEDCYLRACVKKIYLHVDNDNPPRTLILGKTVNPFYENFEDDSQYSDETEDSEESRDSKNIQEEVSIQHAEKKPKPERKVIKVSKKVNKKKSNQEKNFDV